MTDVDEVVGTETEEDSEVQVPFVEPPNRFDKIKESYKGVATALDLSEETAAYEDFQSLLTDHKVREEASACAQSVGFGAYQFVYIGKHTKRTRFVRDHPTAVHVTFSLVRMMQAMHHFVVCRASILSVTVLLLAGLVADVLRGK